MLKIKVIQNDQDQTVLLVVHDESGGSTTLIDSILEHIRQVILAPTEHQDEPIKAQIEPYNA